MRNNMWQSWYEIRGGTGRHDLPRRLHVLQEELLRVLGDLDLSRGLALLQPDGGHGARARERGRAQQRSAVLVDHAHRGHHLGVDAYECSIVHLLLDSALQQPTAQG